MIKTTLLTLSVVTTLLLARIGYSQRQMEDLNRGLVAIRTDAEHVYLGWRVFGDDPDSIAFNIYRNNLLINDTPITGASNYIDSTNTDGTYFVRPVLNNTELNPSEQVEVWQKNYLNIPIQSPPGGTTPDGVNYTYTANDCSVGDLDGDGDYEIILKWDPSNSKDNAHAGYTGNVYLDAYEMNGTLLWRIDLGRNIRAGAHYTQFMVYDFNGDGFAELACKTADATVDGVGTIIGDVEADYRNTSGKILDGPEYLTIFNGKTGAAMSTVDYNPPRGTGDWGDSYGNRVDRFLAGVAYLDGVRPSLLMCRGYYNRSVIAAWDWDGTSLVPRWVFDTDNGYSTYAGQGAHSLSIGDVDNDGKDEIMYGAMAIDDDGSPLYNTQFDHGDATHLGDLLPDNPGLEFYMPSESAESSSDGVLNPGIHVRNAGTGEVIWTQPASGDVGRALTADISAEHPGNEFWAAKGLGIFNSKGEKIAGSMPSINFAIWWDGDDMREILNNNVISKFGVGTLLSPPDVSSNNSTKATPCLQADLFGDWREEVIWRTTDNTALRIYVNPEMTSRKIYTLMHDAQYRVAVAWQNVAYNQPPHPSFFIGDGMLAPPPSSKETANLIWNSGNTWDVASTNNWLRDNAPSSFFNDDDVLFGILGDNTTPIALSGTISPSKVTFNTPKNFVLEGSGELSGDMELIKRGSGTLTMDVNATYTGSTTVWQGALIVMDTLKNSELRVKSFASFGGSGLYARGVETGKYVGVLVGGEGSTGHLRINDHLNLNSEAQFYFDLSADTADLNDQLIVEGDFAGAEDNILNINLLEGDLNAGIYPLISYTGAFTGSMETFKVAGIPTIPYLLINGDGFIGLEILDVRDPATVYWKGYETNEWDLIKTFNWRNGREKDMFAPGDTVVFQSYRLPSENRSITQIGTLPIGKMVVNSHKDFLLSGDGKIFGPGSVVKDGTGKLTIQSINDYTGPTIIKKGTISVDELSNDGKPGRLGTASTDSSNVILNGGTLEITNSNSATDQGFTIGDNGGTFYTPESTSVSLVGRIAGNGTVKKTGAGTLNLGSFNTYRGGTVLEEGTIHLASESAIANGLGTSPLVIKNGGILSMRNDQNSYSSAFWDLIVPKRHTATWLMDGRCAFRGALSGGGTLNIFTPFVRSELFGNWSGFTGNINVSSDSGGGWLILGNDAGYQDASIHLNDNVTTVYRLNGTRQIAIGELSGTVNSQLGSGGEQPSHITWLIGSKNTDAVFDGLISNYQFKGGGSYTSIVKTGTGAWTLTNTNSYTGTTTVEQGKLVVNNASGSGTGSGNVYVDSTGILAGSGTIAGPLEISDQGKLMPGDHAVFGTFTVESDVHFGPQTALKIDINKTNQTNDILQVNGILSLDGTLRMNVVDDENCPPNHRSNQYFEEGDVFTILNLRDSISCNGSFNQIKPSLGHRLDWDMSALCTTGEIRVVKKVWSNQSLLHPNPTPGNLRLTLDEFADHEIPEQIQIVAQTFGGNVVFQQTFMKNSSYEFDVSELPTGIYVLKTYLSQQVLATTFIKN